MPRKSSTAGGGTSAATGRGLLRVELPVLTLEDGHLDKEYSDGRILRYRKDGYSERLFR